MNENEAVKRDPIEDALEEAFGGLGAPADDDEIPVDVEPSAATPELVNARIKNGWPAAEAQKLPDMELEFQFVGKDNIGRYQWAGSIWPADDILWLFGID